MRLGRAEAVLLALLPLAACAPKAADTEPTFMALDCARPYEDLKAAIVGQPQLVAAPEVAAEPYSYYSSPDGRTSYLITKPGAPGHPAILMEVAHQGVHISGCPYGDRAGYAQIEKYLEDLKTWRRKGPPK